MIELYKNKKEYDKLYEEEWEKLPQEDQNKIQQANLEVLNYANSYKMRELFLVKEISYIKQ